MEYNKIIAVTGLPGLYELLNSKTDGAIVRSLDDKSTKFVSSRIHNFSHLESIEIYTVRDNVNLVDILKAMESSTEKLPDEKDSKGLKNYFTKVYPDLDFERVYSSDLKKMVKWFVVLKNNDVEIRLPDPVEENAEEQPEEKADAAAEKPAKKKAVTEKKAEAPAAEKPKKAEAKKAEPAEKPKAKARADEDGKAKKPVKKAVPEKKAAPAAEKPKKAAKKKS
ncbi:MAG TPA: DUF5606 domain-containing protein [Puia sp.]|nr:DUF5606 domain-containing protein [Puia sp.]